MRIRLLQRESTRKRVSFVTIYGRLLVLCITLLLFERLINMALRTPTAAHVISHNKCMWGAYGRFETPGYVGYARVCHPPNTRTRYLPQILVSCIYPTLTTLVLFPKS